MQKYGEIKDLVNAVLESYDKYPVIQNIDCRSRINSESVNDLLEMIRKILFPGYFEIKNLRKDSIEYHVGELLENIEYNLTKQVMMALPHSSKYREADKETLMESAREITHRFLEKIPKLMCWRPMSRQDTRAIRLRLTPMKSFFLIRVCMRSQSIVLHMNSICSVCR